MTKFLPFAVADIGQEEIDEVVDTLRSGWITTGPKTRQFEAEFSDFLGGDVQSIAVNSATAGLHLALEAVGVGPGDEVITTPYTFTASSEVIRYLGAHPVFVDVDPNTLNIDVSSIEERIGPRTKAILPVHVAGLACDMSSILALAAKHNLKVIEDAAHALPTTYCGRLVGTLKSDATVFSFYATKTLTTAEGGMVVTRNSALAARCRVMRLHGISRDAFDRYQSKQPSWYYEVIAAGFKYNLTDVASALGIHQLRKVERMRQRREHIALRYSEAFRSLPCKLPTLAGANDVHAWHLYVLRLEAEARVGRDCFIQSMADKEIGCSVHFIPLHIQPYWAETYGLSPDDFPVALAAYKGAVSLPIYSKMEDSDIDRVIAGVNDLLA